MKLRDVLRVLNPCDYIELIALDKNYTEFTYKGSFIMRKDLLTRLPANILEKRVISFGHCDERRYGLNYENKIVKCDYKIIIEY